MGVYVWVTFKTEGAGSKMATMNGRCQRHSDCRDALDDLLHRLVEEARLEGWNYHEIASALVNFAVDVVPDTRHNSAEQPSPRLLAH